MGIDAKLLASIINSSSGRNWSCDTYNPCPGVLPNVPASRGYTGGFGSALMSKDLGLAMSAAAQSKAPVLLGSLANEVYKLMCTSVCEPQSGIFAKIARLFPHRTLLSSHTFTGV